MTQPEQRRGNILTARIGPLPVWVWFILFVLAVWVFLKYRQKKSGTSSNVNAAPNLTNQPGYLYPIPGDVFVNVTKNGAGAGGGTPPPTGTKGGQPGGAVSGGTHPVTTVHNTPTPPARQASVTTPSSYSGQMNQLQQATGVPNGVIAAANAGMLGARAALSGYTGKVTTKPATPVQVPAGSLHQATAAVTTTRATVSRIATAVQSLKASGRIPGTTSSRTATKPVYNQGRTV